MAIYELNGEQLLAVSETTFSAESLYERKDIQRLLRANIAVLDESLMLITEEFGDWLDSSRRIDLLCLDTDANLVVVELKRTDDGGHMELQALRYAAMVSTMTFEQMVETHARYLSKAQPELDEARAAILAFLGWSSPDEGEFGQDTRIVLASADFSKELTTAVLWLRDRKIDITCVRLKPYRMANGPVLLDVQQLIPLPETASFQTQIGVKRQIERMQRSGKQEAQLKFWEGLLAHAKTRTDLHANRNPTKDHWISGGIGRFGISLNYVILKDKSRVELWIAHGSGQKAKNKAAFKQLEVQRAVIDDKFAGELVWMELPDSDACRICYTVEGGLRSPVEQWQAIFEQLVDAMIRLDGAIREPVQALHL